MDKIGHWWDTYLAGLSVPPRDAPPAGDNVNFNRIPMTQELCPAPETHSGDHISEQLSAIWREILSVDDVDPDQNYFDLGGDSSLAVQMFARIESVFGVRLPLATLYEAPTIAELASILKGELSHSGWSPVVEIQPNGSRPPFFCIHPHGGNVLIYRELARQLGEDQPFFGLQAQGLDGAQQPLTTIEEMATLYLREIRRVQPHGPYFLGGYCMGGAVAYELACQFSAIGEEVALVALFDTMEFSQFPNPSFLKMSYYNCQRFLFHSSNLWKLNSQDRSRFISEKISSLRVRIPVWLSRVRNSSKETDSLAESQILDRIWNANFQAYLKYVGRPYAGVVTDIRPARQYRMFNDPRYKWNQLAQGGQKTIVLPVNPPAMLSDPFVKHLAIVLRQCIDEAIEAKTSSVSNSYAR